MPLLAADMRPGDACAVGIILDPARVMAAKATGAWLLHERTRHLPRSRRYLLVRPGPVEGQAREHLLAPDGWFVTQGDSDIDRPW